MSVERLWHNKKKTGRTHCPDDPNLLADVVLLPRL
jgi:hypothetical protein